VHKHKHKHKRNQKYNRLDNAPRNQEELLLPPPIVPPSVPPTNRFTVPSHVLMHAVLMHAAVASFSRATASIALGEQPKAAFTVKALSTNTDHQIIRPQHMHHYSKSIACTLGATTAASSPPKQIWSSRQVTADKSSTCWFCRICSSP